MLAAINCASRSKNGYKVHKFIFLFQIPVSSFLIVKLIRLGS